MEEEDTRRCMFVFYTLSLKSENFDLYELPTGWNWIGSGKTCPTYNTETWEGWLNQVFINIFGPPTKYTRESQYMGPPETYDDMKKYLDENFNKFKDMGIIKFYHIQDSFMPIPV